jgi:hypothetical protein
MVFPQLKADRLPPRLQEFESVEDALIRFYGLHFQSLEQDLLSCKLGSQDIPANRAAHEVVKSITCALRSFLMGDILTSYQEVSDLLYIKLKGHDLTHQLVAGEILYRMRSSKLGYLYKPVEMHHIPFELRRLVGNQRFSISGIPSLYLGRSIYVCWEELGRPDRHTANVAAFRASRTLRLLDLRMPLVIANSTDCLRIPLALACLVKARDPALPFKPEYIIPQAILHAILNQRQSADAPRYDGIIYHSTRLGSNQKIFEVESLFENIVIPSGNIPVTANYLNDTRFCPTACKHFQVSKVTSKSTFDLLSHTFSQGALEDGTSAEGYRSSMPGKMEEYLTHSDQWHDIIPHKVFRLDPDGLQKY